jgi:hypothetical protein
MMAATTLDVTAARETIDVEAWQIIVAVFLVLLPIALMIDYWPDRERLTARGAPLPRDWRPAARHAPDDDEHH